MNLSTLSMRIPSSDFFALSVVVFLGRDFFSFDLDLRSVLIFTISLVALALIFANCSSYNLIFFCNSASICARFSASISAFFSALAHSGWYCSYSPLAVSWTPSLGPFDHSVQVFPARRASQIRPYDRPMPARGSQGLRDDSTNP